MLNIYNGVFVNDPIFDTFEIDFDFLFFIYIYPPPIPNNIRITNKM